MRYTLYTRSRGDIAIVPGHISRSVGGSYDNEVCTRSRDFGEGRGLESGKGGKEGVLGFWR